MKDSKKSLILIFLCFFLLTVCGAQGVKEKQSTVVEIMITVEEGKAKCDPDPAVAHYGDDVIWKSEYTFTVDFGKRTPFEEYKFRAKKEEAKKGKGAKVTYTYARDTGKKVKFKYLVAVLYEEEILTLDPDLEIRR